MWIKAGVSAALLAICLIGSGASAQTNTQQDRMKACNAQAADKKMAGDARKSFMSDCLSGKVAATPAMTPEQRKAKDCDTAATDKKLAGAARNSFVTACLKK